MATSYEEIYNLAANKITDPEIALLLPEDIEELFHGYLISAIHKFRKCKNDLSNRDDELRQFNVDLLDVEKEILAILVVREWLQPQLYSALLTKQVFSDKEQKYYSQSSHLSELRALDETLKIDAQKLSRDYTYGNSEYLG
ncbi:MAG: hypothetical protein SO471_08160 [Anaerobutyricum hallii]|uniref:hypothetical protein n=1 Tax=Anaerobutyricum hallii TaxID=39488 RepID=UPI002A828CEF|nr:hypothetical protein [Anaerobutyricum hallii]MDY4577924.1 hypothetical protein [Anaerobutyricum hallii]